MNRRRVLTTAAATAVSLFLSTKLHGLNPQILEPAMNVQGWDGGGWAIGHDKICGGGWAIEKDVSYEVFIPVVKK